MIVSIRHRPPAMKALQFDGNNFEEVCDFLGDVLCGSPKLVQEYGGSKYLELTSTMLAYASNWLVLCNGKLSIYTANVFTRDFEIVP